MLIKKFNRNIIIGLLLIAVIIMPVIFMLIFSLRQIVLSDNIAISKNLQKLLLALELRNIESRQRALGTVFVMTGNDSLLKFMSKDATEFNITESALRRLISDKAGLLKLNHVAKTYSERMKVANQGIAMRRNGATIEAVDAYYKALPSRKVNITLYAMDDLVRHTSTAYEAQKNRNFTFAHQIVKFLGLASGVTFLLLLIIIGLLIWMIRHKSLMDNTGEQLAKKERQLSNARKEVLEVVAHDLKSPLSAIILSIKIIEGKETKGEFSSIRKYLSITANAANSMEHLITGLLDNSKIESGHFILSKQKVQFDLLVQAIAIRFQPITESEGLQLNVCIQPGEWSALLDTVRIEQVISNLLANAIKFTKPRGTVTLQLLQDADCAVLSVTDTGNGMLPNQMEHIFERYWQARETAAKGTGLGLAISKGIVDAHGGKIWVESTVGKGSVFFFSVPLCLEMEPLPAAAQ